MNKPNALNPGASSTAPAIREADAGRDGLTDETSPAEGQAFENSKPGAVGNVPGAHKAASQKDVAPSMKQTSQTDAERTDQEPDETSGR